jgi:MarR family transcriptional regulator, organic hydroperoxide resistance regulator
MQTKSKLASPRSVRAGANNPKPRGGAQQNDLMLLDVQLCFALYRASRAVIRAYSPVLEPLELTYLQYLVMLVLWEKDGFTVSELGDRLALDSATLTPLLKKLELRKFVLRNRDEKDGRIVRIDLTESGQRLKIKCTGIPKHMACTVGINLEDSQAVRKSRELHDELHRIASTIDA